MANEAYRAVFLRIHPTGKMVLSLTTDADGHEPEYAQLVAEELGVPPLDVKVVPADTDRFGIGHGFNTSAVGRDARGDLQRHGEDPREGAAARGHGARDRARQPDVVNGAWVSGDGSDPERVQTIEAIALYAHGTGAAAARSRGRARRPGRLQRLTGRQAGAQHGVDPDGRRRRRPSARRTAPCRASCPMRSA